MAAEPFASALPCAWHTADLEGMFSHYVGGAALVDHFIGGDFAAINTDDLNEIEYGFARTLGRTDWDATGALCRQSVEIGDHRPPVSGGAVDWKAVALGRQWDAVVRGGKKLSADDLALNEGAYDNVLERYVAKDARGMLVAWESLPYSAPCLTELAVIAHLYAESGNSKAEPLIEQLRNHLPTEAAALQGILAWRQRKFSESGERLATALRRLRSDPWVLDHIRVKTFDAAIRVAKADPRQAPKLLQAFGEPFAVYSADENRLRYGLRHCGGTRPGHGRRNSWSRSNHTSRGRNSSSLIVSRRTGMRDIGWRPKPIETCRNSSAALRTLRPHQDRAVDGHQRNVGFSGTASFLRRSWALRCIIISARAASTDVGGRPRPAGGCTTEGSGALAFCVTV